MRTKILVYALAALVLATIHLAEAQQTGKMRKIGFLIQGRGISGSPSPFFEAFRQGMRELGYVEGQNITIEYRSGERGAQLTELATELVQQKVEVIVAGGPGASAAQRATATLPIVFA